MKVEKLIKILERADPSTEVFIRTPDNELAPISELTLQYAVDDSDSDIFIVS